MPLPPFMLHDGSTSRSFPGERPVLLCFVKEDCPTCGISMPLIEVAHRAYGSAVDVWAIGQDTPGNAALVQRYGLTTPMLDDDALDVSFAYDLVTVPTVILADSRGEELRRFEGFGREDWRKLFADPETLAGAPCPEVEWLALPEMRPGCGSRSVEPDVAERLAARAAGSPLRARRIEIAPGDDEFEFMFDQGLTDGLPVIPPTPERVLRMLRGTARDPQEVVAIVPPNMSEATVERVAINAVMAGCRPEFLPVVLAALEAVCTDEFNVHGVMATTMGAAPVLVVNGPVRERIGMNMGMGALGQGNRANATIGRALRLVLRNVGGARPGGTERSTFGSPLKFTMSFAEWEERSPWEPLHVERGFGVGDSVVTAFGMTAGPQLIVDQTSRSARQLAGAIGVGIEGAGHPKSHGAGDVLLVVGPEHADTLSREGFTKAALRARIQEVTARPLRELVSNAEVGGGPQAPPGADAATLERLVPKFADGERIHIVVAGGQAGKWSAYFSGWTTGPRGTIVTSKRIEERL